jgi:diguanylate cyclase (GGDEF)-like protein
MGEIVVEDGRKSFFYMAPLITEQACLQCHEDQGYKLGDVRGGISVEIPYDDTTHAEAVILASHAGLFLSGLGAVLVFFRRLTSYVDRTEYDAEHDVLTGLPNRRSVLADLDKEYRRSRRHGTPMTVMMIDVDHFKPINDTHGHAAGDDCLRELTTTLRRLLRRGRDELGRLGGEEFLAVLPDTDREAAPAMAEQLRAAAGELAFVDASGKPFSLTISIGLATRSDADANSEALLERADRALYRAKQSGRNRVCEADDDLA